MSLESTLDRWERDAKEFRLNAGLGQHTPYTHFLNNRTLKLIEIIRKKDEALKQCQASTSVLAAIEYENNNIKGISRVLGGYSKALEEACELALEIGSELE